MVPALPGCRRAGRGRGGGSGPGRPGAGECRDAAPRRHLSLSGRARHRGRRPAARPSPGVQPRATAGAATVPRDGRGRRPGLRRARACGAAEPRAVRDGCRPHGCRALRVGDARRAGSHPRGRRAARPPRNHRAPRPVRPATQPRQGSSSRPARHRADVDDVASPDGGRLRADPAAVAGRRRVRQRTAVRARHGRGASRRSWPASVACARPVGCGRSSTTATR
jgi:hypothetical protein